MHERREIRGCMYAHVHLSIVDESLPSFVSLIRYRFSIKSCDAVTEIYLANRRSIVEALVLLPRVRILFILCINLLYSKIDPVR